MARAEHVAYRAITSTHLIGIGEPRGERKRRKDATAHERSSWFESISR